MLFPCFETTNQRVSRGSENWREQTHKGPESQKLHCLEKVSSTPTPHMSMLANNALLGGGVRVRVLIREQRKIKRRSKALLSL